jgi:hypothetical protein
MSQRRFNCKFIVMTREEQIQQAEINYSDDTIFDGCDYIGQVAKQEAFIAGAKWADEHPNPDTVKRIFEFALNNTNFLIADNLDSIDWDKLVKRAMEE